jgi:hypothetical protein
MEQTSLLINAISTSPFIVAVAGPSLSLPRLAIVSRSEEMLNGPISILPLKSLSHARTRTMAVMVEIHATLMNGFIRTILLMRLALHIRLMAIPTVLAALQKLDVRTVFQLRDAGLKKELKFTQLRNMVLLLENLP